MHPTDLQALLAVMQAEAAGVPLTPGRLGEHLGLSSGATTAVVDRLERAEHVRRERDDRDRRRITLHYGAAAAAVGGAFFGPLGARIEHMLAGFTPDELAVVRRFLEQTNAVMRAHREAVTSATADAAGVSTAGAASTAAGAAGAVSTTADVSAAGAASAAAGADSAAAGAVSARRRRGRRFRCRGSCLHCRGRRFHCRGRRRRLHRRGRQRRRRRFHRGGRALTAFGAAPADAGGITTSISPPSANPGARSRSSPLQKRPGSYQLGRWSSGSRPISTNVSATTSAQ